MNRYRLSKAGISANAGIERFYGDRELYECSLNKFPKDPHYEMMIKAIGEKDVKAAFAAAHALKGLAGNLSMVRLYDHICPLVELLRGGTLEGADELLPAVVSDYEALTAALTPTEE